MPQRVSVVRVSPGEGVGYVLDLTAEALALFDREGERKNYLMLQEILTDMRLTERASMGDSFIPWLGRCGGRPADLRWRRFTAMVRIGFLFPEIRN